MIAGAALALAVAATAATGAYRDPAGEERRLEALHGQVAVVNFWATWCKPCLEEMPALERLHRRFGASGVRVVGLSADDASDSRAVERLVARLAISYPVWLGATTDDMRSLGLDPVLPGTAVLGRDGRVTARFSGTFDEAALVAAVEAALASPEAAGPVAEAAAAAPARAGGSRVPP